MSISAKRKLVAGAAGLAVLAGGGGAYAAGASGTTTQPADRAAEQKAFLDDVAKRLNVTRDQLDAAVKGAAEARIDAAVAAGRLTQEQGEAAKQRLGNGTPLLGPGVLGGGGEGGAGRPGGRGGFFFGLDAAAGYLGLSESELRDQLDDGKSLADVAKARNKDVAGLETALKDAITKQLDEAVSDGKLTAERRTEILDDLDSRLDDVINQTRPSRSDRPRHRWR